VDAFVHRLEDRIRRLVPGGGTVSLAYSGGLASTIVAMVARKRCELECVVAGSVGSPDLLAAESARQHLDLRIEQVLLDAVSTKRIREGIASTRPDLSSNSILSLIPLVAIVEHADRELWFAGFGSPRMEPQVAAAIRQIGVRTPLADAAADTGLSRYLLRSAGRSLGIPEGWVRVPHRAPGDGAGITKFL
jgi:hypothetical protein